MSFHVVAPNFEQTCDRWIDALELAKSKIPTCKGIFQQVKILENGKLVWLYDRFHRHPQFYGAGTYNRLARRFLEESSAEERSTINTEENLTMRMLLSHNFTLTGGSIPILTREAFAAIFMDGLQDCAQCRLVENPHWIVEVLFDATQFSATQMGDRYAQALAHYRRALNQTNPLPQILILGGVKNTPATSDSPDALQPGDWGVDVVETEDIDTFLESIGWESAIASKAPETIFKVAYG
jgi:hypothetical protein